MIVLIFYLLILDISFANHENHNKPFGSGHRYDIRYSDGFIDPVEFITMYVSKNEPLLFKQGAKIWPAMTQWSDDYFLNLNLSQYAKTAVHVEVQKKENRSLGALSMDFKKFVSLYNSSDIYLVDKLPSFLDADVVVPWSLQCSLWENSINQVLMWFSSGGTSSVVHTDDMENINCLLSGEKTFVLVNPHKHKDKILMHAKGAYSDIDVDKVDFTKFPGMATVDFHIAEMVAGDCLYIPKLWIHQVRSFHRNIAINIWFTKPKNELTSLTVEELRGQCAIVPLTKTFTGVEFLGLSDALSILRDVMKPFGNIGIEEAYEAVLRAYPEFDSDTVQMCKEHIYFVINDIFIELDKNRNSFIEMDEIKSSTNESLTRVANYLKYLKVYLESLALSTNNGYNKYGKAEVVDSSVHSEL